MKDSFFPVQSVNKCADRYTLLMLRSHLNEVSHTCTISHLMYCVVLSSPFLHLEVDRGFPRDWSY
jgi:hypothetical protein